MSCSRRCDAACRSADTARRAHDSRDSTQTCDDEEKSEAQTPPRSRDSRPRPARAALAAYGRASAAAKSQPGGCSERLWLRDGKFSADLPCKGDLGFPGAWERLRYDR
jgi:hypothetical protein